MTFRFEFYLHRQSLLLVLFTVLFFLSSSLSSPIVNSPPSSVSLPPHPIFPSPSPTSSLHRPRIRPSPYPVRAFPVRQSPLSVLSIPLPAPSVSILIIIYFLLNFPLSLFLLSWFCLFCVPSDRTNPQPHFVIIINHTFFPQLKIKFLITYCLFSFFVVPLHPHSFVIHPFWPRWRNR